MDSIDEKILTILKQNARTKVTHIAKEVHLSEPSTLERIRKLESTGVIKQYTTVIDYEKVQRRIYKTYAGAPRDIRGTLHYGGL